MDATTWRQVPAATDPADPAPVLGLMEAVRDFATVATEHGWSVEQVEAEVIRRVYQGLEIADEPAWDFVRSALIGAIDEALAPKLDPTTAVGE